MKRPFFTYSLASIEYVFSNLYLFEKKRQVSSACPMGGRKGGFGCGRDRGNDRVEDAFRDRNAEIETE